MSLSLPSPASDLSEHDLRALHVFRVVAEAGGLTAAEPLLHLERSTISRHIKALEGRLGSVLCHRGPRGFQLTEFGRDVFSAAVVLGDAMDEARTRLSGSRQQIVGELRIGLADNCLTNPEARLAQTIGAFAEAAPAVELTVTIGAPSDLIRALLERHIHMCVSGVPLNDVRFHASPLFKEEFRLYVCSTGVAPHVSELAAWGFGLVVRTGHAAGIAPLPVAQLGSLNRVHAVGLEGVATLIATGRYTGMLPTHYAESLRPRLSFVEVVGSDHLLQSVHFSIVGERSRPPTRAMRRLREIAVAAHESR